MEHCSVKLITAMVHLMRSLGSLMSIGHTGLVR